MNRPEDILHHTFRRVRQAQVHAHTESPLPTAAPEGFATRVLAGWRREQAYKAAGSEVPSRDWTLWLLPRAIGVAAACALTLFALQAVGDSSSTSEGAALGSLVMNLALEEAP